jgi:adenylate cyclase
MTRIALLALLTLAAAPLQAQAPAAPDPKLLARAERILALNPLDGRALAVGSLALLEIGDAERADEWSRRAVELYPDDLSALLNRACLKLRCKQPEEALDLLERFFGRGMGKRDWVEQDPDYDSVREHPRFKAMFAKLK